MSLTVHLKVGDICLLRGGYVQRFMGTCVHTVCFASVRGGGCHYFNVEDVIRIVSAECDAHWLESRVQQAEARNLMHDAEDARAALRELRKKSAEDNADIETRNVRLRMGVKG